MSSARWHLKKFARRLRIPVYQFRRYGSHWFYLLSCLLFFFFLSYLPIFFSAFLEKNEFHRPNGSDSVMKLILKLFYGFLKIFEAVCRIKGTSVNSTH